MHYFSKNETVIPSLKNDCRPSLAHFGNDQSTSRDDNEVEQKLLLKHWIPFRLMLYIQSKFHVKNQSRKMLKR